MNLIIALVVVGASLMFLEVFFPGIAAAVAGSLCWLTAVILGYRGFGFRTGNLLLSGLMVVSVIVAFCWLKFLPRNRIARIRRSERAARERELTKPDLLSRTGVAITQLRPAGAAFINGKRIEVTTEGPLIDSGASVKVIAVSSNRVVVRAL